MARLQRLGRPVDGYVGWFGALEDAAGAEAGAQVGVATRLLP